VDGAYNELRQNCDSAARKLGARSLRPVEIKQLQAGKARLTVREYECAHHVVSEIARGRRRARLARR
jgi:galactokinase